MLKLMPVVFLMALVVFFSFKAMGDEELEYGSKWLGSMLIALGFIGACAVFVGFRMIIKSVDQTPLIMRAMAEDSLPKPPALSGFSVHAPVGCIVYFKTKSDAVRPVKSTGEAIPFEKGEVTAVMSGKKCKWEEVWTSGPVTPMKEKSPGGGVTVRL